jgi:hypothetical protein
MTNMQPLWGEKQAAVRELESEGIVQPSAPTSLTNCRFFDHVQECKANQDRLCSLQGRAAPHQSCHALDGDTADRLKAPPS